MVVWNAQAFFTTNDVKFAAKIGYLHQLLAKYDVVVVVEAHGTDGGAKAWRPPIGCSAWWSAGPTAGSAGVGIVIKDSFLGNFENRPVWTTMWLGGPRSWRCGAVRVHWIFGPPIFIRAPKSRRMISMVCCLATMHLISCAAGAHEVPLGARHCPVQTK